MNHLSGPKVLRLAALTIGLTPVSAIAQMQTYFHAAAWDAFSGRNDKGGAVCGIGTTNPANNHRLSIRFDIGGNDTTLSASKPDWAIPDNTRVTVVMQIGLNTPWIEQATGHGHSIDWTLDRGAFQTFDQQFRNASSMTLTFPDGNEPPWTLPLAGSSAASGTFARCIADLTRQVQAAQPPPNGAPPPQGATQPFGAPPPTEPSPAGPPPAAPPSQ